MEVLHMDIVAPSLPPDYVEPDDSFRRRWPPKKFPGLHLSTKEFVALRRRERQQRRLLELLGPPIADIAVAIMEEHHGRRI
jgi:hypothetical protein